MMKYDNDILERNGWKQSFMPVYFLGMDISWLVMEEVFISPYDHKTYSFSQAMQQEQSLNGHLLQIIRAA